MSLISTGSRGDTLALLPLAVELRERGVTVTVFSASAPLGSFDFELEGLEVFPLGVGSPARHGPRVVYGAEGGGGGFWEDRAAAGAVSGAAGLEWLDALYAAMIGMTGAIVTDSPFLPGFAEAAAERAGIPLEKMAVSLPAECSVNRTDPAVATKTLALRAGALMDRISTWTVLSEWRFEAGMPMIFGLHRVAPARLTAWTRTTRATRDSPSPQLDGVIAVTKMRSGLAYVELPGLPDEVINAVLRGLAAMGSGVLIHPDTPQEVIPRYQSRTTILLTKELMGGKPLDREWLMQKCTLAVHAGDSFLVGAAARAKITTLVVEGEERSWYDHIRANRMGNTVSAWNATVPDWLGHSLLWSLVQETITVTSKGNPDLFGEYP